MWRARGLRRGHQRALSQGPVCNYRHEAWPHGRTIGPLSLRLFQSPDRRDRIFDLSAFGPSAIPSTRRGISIATIDRRATQRPPRYHRVDATTRITTQRARSTDGTYCRKRPRDAAAALIGDVATPRPCAACTEMKYRRGRKGQICLKEIHIRCADYVYRLSTASAREETTLKHYMYVMVNYFKRCRAILIECIRYAYECDL